MGDDQGRPVLLVEDHALVAASLAAALDAVGIRLVTVDPDPETDLVAIATEHGCELVLLDLHLGRELHGVDVVPVLRAAGLRVVVLTATEDRLEIARAFEAGAEGYVSKRASFDELVATVGRAVAGEELYHPTERDRLARQLRTAREQDRHHRELFDALTPREREILWGLCAGRNAQELADEAVVAVSTVRSHIRGVLTKLGVGSQMAAVALARQTGWELRR